MNIYLAIPLNNLSVGFDRENSAFFLKVENNQNKNSKQSLQKRAVRIYVLTVHSSEDVMIPFSWASKRSKDFTEV